MRAPITDKHLLEMMWERFPEIMQRGAEQPDKGPWHVGVTRNDSRVYLQSNDFKHDVRLYVDGDFADLKQRIEYAERLKRNMNGEDHPAQPEQEPVAVDKKGSPCPEFWDWLPKAYNFEGVGNFTKYNMEVAFLAGMQTTSPPAQRTWAGLTDEEVFDVWLNEMPAPDKVFYQKLCRSVEAKLKEKNT